MRTTKEHCKYCFDSLQAAFDKSKTVVCAFEKQKAPIFVTWTKSKEEISDVGNLSALNALTEESYTLRGCIGTFSAVHLDTGLKQYAVTAAMKDPRFPPVIESELPLLKVAVSLLVNFTPNKKAFDWEIGKHGIIIHFTDAQKEAYSATYLPEVAESQAWTRKQTVDSLIRKAGFNGMINESFYDEISLTSYESSKASLSYYEWQQLC